MKLSEPGVRKAKPVDIISVALTSQMVINRSITVIQPVRTWEKNNQLNELLLEVQLGSETLDNSTTGGIIVKGKAMVALDYINGIKTLDGKVVSSRNAYNGGERSLLCEMSELLHVQGFGLKEIV